jgi:hypothetical protein
LKEFVTEIEEIKDEVLEKGFQYRYDKRWKDKEAHHSRAGREHSLDIQ